jgi:phosphoribosyl 1,2-cyclic phosphodiesterase
MKAKFWGCRGSLPSTFNKDISEKKVRKILEKAIEDKICNPEQIDGFIENLPFALRSSYGTNTSCVQIIGGNEVVICDAGSGLRDLGKELVKLGPLMPKTIHILMSHLHWDHIQGFPFFIPAYFQGVAIKIYGCHDTIESAFREQQNEPTFPVQLRDMGSEISFHKLLIDKTFDIGGIEISIIEQPHPGLSYGYKFIKDGKTIVYSTDAEHTEESQSDDYPYLDFIRGCDLLIFDGQFNLADHMYTKQNWGHSSNLVGIELAIRGHVKQLCLFHSDHTFSDFDLDKFLKDSLRYREIYDDSSDLDIMIGYDGLEIDLS